MIIYTFFVSFPLVIYIEKYIENTLCDDIKRQQRNLLYIKRAFLST